MARFQTLYLFLTFFLPIHSFAQTKNEPGKPLHIRKAKGAIHLDGKLDEADWKESVVATDFYLNYPVDTALAPFQTEARLTFDDRSLYVSFVCYDNKTPDIVQSLRRDFEFENNDNIGVYLGPYNDGINGFYFIVTPMGVQMEGTIAGSGAGDESFNQAWDNKWYSKVVRLEDRWVTEMRIPFKSFRYKSQAEEWNITFLRWDLKRNLVSSWIATPIQFIPASFGYSGKLVWTEKPPPQSTNISLIRFVAGGFSKDHETNPVTTGSDLQFGLDAKLGVTPSLNLDLTINPDFSQVEVDRQVINLTRFEFQFPERRQFFLENSDLFDLAGFPEARPFFSRRIGIARDTSDNLQRVPILYGARLSGSISKNWRVSMLNMQTKEKLSLGLPAQNYSVATLQRNFWKQSNFSLTFVDKESLGVDQGDSAKFFHPDLWKEKIAGADTARTLNKYNRVLSADMELRSSDNKWYSSIFYSGSMDSFSESGNQSGGVFGNYRIRNLGLFLGQTFVQKDYNAEVGYVPSKGVYPGQVNYFVSANGTSYPKGKTLVNTGPGVDFNIATLPDGTITDKALEMGWNFNLLNTSSFGITYNRVYQRLTNTFNPIDEDKYLSYNLGEEYSWGAVELDYESDQRKIFKYDLETSYGGFYNGYNWNVNGEFSYRYQPFGSISVRFDYNDLQLPQGYGQEKLFVVSPRMDLTFTDKLFLTTFVQYNTLADNVNLNARFQWRYKPASDFFVVYTENYLPRTFASKSRALVFKFTYWLNI